MSPPCPCDIPALRHTAGMLSGPGTSPAISITLPNPAVPLPWAGLSQQTPAHWEMGVTMSPVPRWRLWRRGQRHREAAQAPALRIWRCCGGREGSGGRRDAVPGAGTGWEREKRNSWHLPGSHRTPRMRQSEGETEARLDPLQMYLSSRHCHKSPENLGIGFLLLQPTASLSPPSPPAVAADTCSASSNSPLPGIFGLLQPPAC